ncbi:1,2-dihydroxy-3-keto-5-methylthiopentene dioxygenase [Tremella mesenterica]|uniref:Acireductone dioxygenase n=1 Tax=Tremella mesenterica TaxID=5217 RepID=A0A4Q1BRS6_TREME|nr:1,2-dihydroxy-3-keto-5-methylthiopentene dioxygenase [Tremella mesenterica]
MRAYIYDDLPGDQRQPHDSGIEISSSELERLGLVYVNIPIDEEGQWEKEIDTFAEQRGYKNRDRITVTKAGLGEAYETKIKSFFDEHLHEDEEIRYILDGSGYFDVRGSGGEYDERWIRVSLTKGDLLVLPAGIYHRFTVDHDNAITAMRLFQDEPKWTPYSRTAADTDVREARAIYLNQVKRAVGLA